METGSGNCGDVGEKTAFEKNDFNMGDDNNDVPRPFNKEELEEQQHFFDIINTFCYYKHYNLRKVNRRISYLNDLPIQHQNLLENYRAHLLRVEASVLHNYEIIKLMIEDSAKIFKNHQFFQNHAHRTLITKPEKDLHVDRIDSVLNQIVREWCFEGINERECCFSRILNTIEKYFPDVENRDEIRILVPGAGLGRLPYEIAKRGYSCQGNEFSMMMLIVSNFILNKVDDINLYQVYPWISQYSNNLSTEHQTMAVRFPDVNPTNIPKNVNFSMVAGSFTDVFGCQNEKEFDCVVTCFFLDTAQNIVSYIDTIWKILKPGGKWINFGPLLYHYADTNERSIEPSYEIVKEIIESFNFKFLEEEVNISSYYTRNPNSMVSYQYHSVFFVCEK